MIKNKEKIDKKIQPNYFKLSFMLRILGHNLKKKKEPKISLTLPCFPALPAEAGARTPPCLAVSGKDVHLYPCMVTPLPWETFLKMLREGFTVGTETLLRTTQKAITIFLCMCLLPSGPQNVPTIITHRSGSRFVLGSSHSPHPIPI